ncbi:MAG: futalosine hydrolase [Phycisphaerae bacterium]|nr:futalosine hydrolase [Saprospiraceae bacterium]
MHILLVAATPFEIAPTLAWLETNFQQKSAGVFEKGPLRAQVLVTGVGMTATAFHLGRFFAQHRPDWAINAGIAGAFDPTLNLGDVVQLVGERFGDLGVEEADGRFTDIAELGLMPQSLVSNPQPPIPNLRICQGLTVNKVHGTEASIQKIRVKYPEAQVESMEGAAFFLACLASAIPLAEIRSISNRVEARNRDAWDLPLAIRNLNEVVVGMLMALEF